MIQAEKLKNFDEAKFKPGFVSEKLNGIHAIYDPILNEFYSRTPNIIRGLDHLKPSLHVYPFPLAGELIIPDLPFQEMSGKIRSHEDCLEAQFHIFNIVQSNIPFIKRFAIAKNSLEYIDPAFIQFVSMTFVYTLEQFHKEYDLFIYNGAEGACWINPEHVYQPGKRTWNWMKKVPMRSLEAKIIEILPGTPGKKYEHSLGAFRCKCEEKVFKVGIFKGQTDTWRQDVWDNREGYIGETVTVEYKDLSLASVPVQPRFKCFRWDL